jgi:hypothetical protein
MRYDDCSNDNSSNRNNALEKSNNLSIFVSAMKPIRNLHVTYRGQTYTIREGVSTVNELTARFERLNNNSVDPVLPKGIVWKGQILKPGDDLSKAGIKHGDRVMILPGDKETKAVDILAVYLFLLSSNEKAIEDAISKIKKEQPEALEGLKDMVQSIRDGLNNIDRRGVANFLRSAFDLSYHRLRSWWEHPSLRQGLHDPDRIENYRKVVSTNLSAKFIKKVSSPSSQLQKIIESPELWRREFTKIATKAIRCGDTILEGILELLLDILKGRGSSSARSNQYFSETQSSSSEAQNNQDGGIWGSSSEASGFSDTVTNEMEDPSLANNLLFELSESEDDFDLDDL